MKVLFLFLFILGQLGGLANSPPQPRLEGEIVISQDELMSFLRLLVSKKMELQKIANASKLEDSGIKSIETSMGSYYERVDETQSEAPTEKRTLKEETNALVVQQSTKMEVPVKQADSAEISRIDEILKRLEQSIEDLRQERLRDEVETKAPIRESVAQEQESKEKTSDFSNLEKSLKAQSDEISYLRFMIENLAMRSSATAEKPTQVISRQPVYIVSSQPSPTARQVVETQPRANEEVEKPETNQTGLFNQEFVDKRIQEPIIASEKSSPPANDEEILELVTETFMGLALENQNLLMKIDTLTKMVSGLKANVRDLFEQLAAQTTKEEVKKKPAVVPFVQEKMVVFFGNDSHTITDKDKERIKETVGRAVEAVQGIQVFVDGYSSNTGSAAYNMQLSKKRAQAVESELVNLGLMPSQIIISYHGIDKEATEENARRVEIVIQEIKSKED